MRRLPELDLLEARRIELAAESDTHRQSFVREYRNIEASTAWMRHVLTLGRAALPFVTLIATLRSVFARRSSKVTRQATPAWMLGFQTAQSLVSVWQAITPRRGR